MKKRVKRKVQRATSRTRRRTRTHRSGSSEYITLTPISFRRVIYIGTFLALVVGFFLVFNRPVMRQAVEGMSITRSLYAQSAVQLPTITGSVSYNVYYKPEADGTFTHAVRKIPATVRFFNISYLRKGTNYQYQISAVNSSGSEFWWSPILPLSNIESM